MRLTFITIMLLLFSFSANALWTKMADLPGKGRHRGTGIAIGNKGYIGLGHYNGTGTNIMLADWWEYDPSNNTWAQKANYPSLNYAALAFGTSTKGYVGGGITGGSNFYEYDPSLNTWTSKASLPSSITDSQGFVLNDKAYYFDNGLTYEYDPSTDNWTTKGPTPFGGVFWNSAFAINEKGYVQSGSQFWEYKATTDSWIIRASYPGLAGSATVGFSQRGQGYIMTGFSGGLSNVTNEVWKYDPYSNSWTQLEDFPGTSRRFASGFSINDKSYFGIGTNGTNFSDFWCFDLLASMHEESISHITCFPNPTSEFIQLKWELSGNFDVIIHDQKGSVKLEQKGAENILKINCVDWEKGQYFISISPDGNSHYQSSFIVR